MILITMVTVANVTAERRRPALFDVGQRSPVTGQDPLAVFGPIVRPILFKDIGQAAHGRSAINSSMTWLACPSALTVRWV